MALLDNGLKPTLGGIAIGIGVALAAPVIIPVLAGIAKPVAKSVIKGGLFLYKTGREAAQEAQTTIEGLMKEVKAEAVAVAPAAAKRKKAAKTEPISQKIVKEGKALYTKGKGVITEAKQSIEQLVEEAKSEIAAEAAAKEL